MLNVTVVISVVNIDSRGVPKPCTQLLVYALAGIGIMYDVYDISGDWQLYVRKNSCVTGLPTDPNILLPALNNFVTLQVKFRCYDHRRDHH